MVGNHCTKAATLPTLKGCSSGLKLHRKSFTMKDIKAMRHFPNPWLLVVGFILSLGTFGFASLIPSELDLSLKVEIFRTMAQLGGVLLGLTGSIGIFTLESVRSVIRDIQRLRSEISIPQTEFERRRLPPDFRRRKAEEMQKAFGRLYSRGTTPMSAFLISIICYVLQIMTAILGLASSPSGGITIQLFLTFEMMVLGALSFVYMATSSIAI